MPWIISARDRTQRLRIRTTRMPTSPMSRKSFGARALRLLVVPLAFAAGTSLPSCGTDGGVSAFLPPGPPTQAPPGDIVIYRNNELKAQVADAEVGQPDRVGARGLEPEPHPRRVAQSFDPAKGYTGSAGMSDGLCV